ncbi:MAG: FAD-dependent oxidoreductase [Candidatus Shapirobacteria bacterium]
MNENNFDVIIIGSGPAGLTAAIYTQRAGLSTLVLAGNMPGGQLTITTTVENYPGFAHGTGGVTLMMAMQEQVKNLGVEIRNGNVKSIKNNFETELDNGEILKSKAVIVGTGASAKWLGLPNEMELMGKGVSGCATCDGMFFRDKTVAVVGGGAVACEDASFLSKMAKKVYLIHRRDSFRATKAEVDLVMNNQKIEIIWNTEIIELNPPDPAVAGSPSLDKEGSSKLTLIKIINNKTNEEKVLPVDGLFVAIGRTPSTEFLKGVVDLKENNYVITGTNNTFVSMTNIEGIFAAGDCMDEIYRQAVVAAGAGAKAAIDCEKWMKSVN